MKIRVDPSKLEKIISRMLLKGKYYAVNATTNATISNYVVMEAKDNCLNLYNGNNTTLCVFSIPVIQTPAVYSTIGTILAAEDEGECVVEISSLVT